jgi:hypothetical protein
MWCKTLIAEVIGIWAGALNTYLFHFLCIGRCLMYLSTIRLSGLNKKVVVNIVFIEECLSLSLSTIRRVLVRYLQWETLLSMELGTLAFKGLYIVLPGLWVVYLYLHLKGFWCSMLILVNIHVVIPKIVLLRLTAALPLVQILNSNSIFYVGRYVGRFIFLRVSYCRYVTSQSQITTPLLKVIDTDSFHPDSDSYLFIHACRSNLKYFTFQAAGPIFNKSFLHSFILEIIQKLNNGNRYWHFSKVRREGTG